MLGGALEKIVNYLYDYNKTIIMTKKIYEKSTVSVVICTRNRSDYLKKCLISLLNQSYQPKEIIIVNDDPEKNFSVYNFFKNEFQEFTDKLIKLLDGIDIILIKNKNNSGIVASRNTGIMVASGDIVAFCDDDGFAHKNWLKNLVKNYKDNKILGVGGPVIEIGRNIKTPKRPITKLAYIKNGKIVTNYRIKKLKEIHYLPKKFVPFLQGGNMCFRRDALLQIKGGDTNLTGNCYREETDLCLRIAKKGKLLFEPYAITYHDTAKKGGCRDIINFDLNKFFYYMFRNTTYFFFKHFSIKKAFNFTLNSISRQIKLLQKDKTGLTRDYLKITNKRNHSKSIIFGSFEGFYSWFKSWRRELEMMCTIPTSINCFKLVFIGGIFKIVEIDNKTNFIKKLFGL